MGYFDNPDNKAAWDRELEALRIEKIRRREGIYDDPIFAEEEYAPEAEYTEEYEMENELYAPEAEYSEPKAEFSAPEAEFSEPESVYAEQEAETVREAPAAGRAPKAAKPAPARASRPVDMGGSTRVQITFEELLKEAGMYTKPALNMPSKDKQLQKEVQREM